MDTKSKSFNRTPGFKALCIVLSIALMFGSALSAVIAVGKGYSIGTMEGLTRGCGSYYDSLLFVSRFSQAATDARILLSEAEAKESQGAQQAQKAEITAEVLKAFRNEKAEIIRDELTFVVNHYDSEGSAGETYYDEELDCDVYIYYGANGTKTVYDYGDRTEVEYSTQLNTQTAPASSGENATEATTTPAKEGTTAVTEPPTESAPLYAVDEWAPANVQAAQKALNAKGTDILQYETLVRGDAFDRIFCYEVDINGDCVTFDTTIANNEAEAQEDFEQQFDAFCAAQTYDRQYRVSMAKSRLAAYKNLKYYIVDANGTVTTNLETKAAPADSKDYKVWFAAVGSTVTQRNLDAAMGTEPGKFFGSPTPVDYSFGPKGLTDGTKAAVYFYLEFGDVDAFSRDLDFFTANFNQGPTPAVMLAFAAVLFILALAALCFAFPGIGHKNGEEAVTLRAFDKVPADIHAALSLAFICLFDVAAFCGGVIYLGIGDYTGDLLPYLQPFFFNGFTASVTAFCLTAAWALLAQWLCSVIRIKKAGKSWFGSFVFIRLAVWCIRKFVSLCRKVIALFRYKPKKFRRNVLLLALLYFFVNFLLLIPMMVFAARSSAARVLFTLLLFVALNAWVVWYVLHYIKQLDTVIDASGRACPVDTTAPGYPTSLKALADNMNLTQENLQQAVDAALRDERMKTELITNVSHDLKTPLTSIINYVDLLRHCDIQDETAKGYLDVLDEKSKRLKSLIEDLVEASKASSGAVTLNLVDLNLNELAGQVIGEMDEDFSANRLAIEFLCPDEPTLVTADSQKTYRIIDNLLTNARKYSLPDSRVYITVSKGTDCAFFEVKNISRDKLNITGEELMERFVRGDKARTDGGNGLGLSIARDLAALQNGQLVLTIDGDMFKATLCLPLKKSSFQA